MTWLLGCGSMKSRWSLNRSRIRRRDPNLPSSHFSQRSQRRQIAERRAAREREREASRPFYQFINQVSKERDRIQDLSRVGELSAAASADINTKAYENVRNTWMKRGIWNKNWGLLPGMSWKHDERLEEESADSPAPVQANLLENGNYEATSTACTFRSSPSAGKHRRQVSVRTDTSRKRQSADSEAAGLVNGDVGSYSPPHKQRKRVLRSTARQTEQPSGRHPSPRDVHTQSAASTSIGPAHSSKDRTTPETRPPVI